MPFFISLVHVTCFRRGGVGLEATTLLCEERGEEQKQAQPRCLLSKTAGVCRRHRSIAAARTRFSVAWYIHPIDTVPPRLPCSARPGGESKKPHRYPLDPAAPAR